MKLSIKNNEANSSLAQVFRLQNKIEEIKRMENDEIFKIKRDEIKLRKGYEDIKLKYKRVCDNLTKLQQKEDEVNELRVYFHDKKQKEEDESVQNQLKFEKEKHSLLGIFRHKNKQLALWLVSYLDLSDLNTISALNKSYRSIICHENMHLWRFSYRRIHLTHREVHEELLREIEVKKQEIK